jgi:3-oxoacyl-[acyl-carrier protein] reductase
VHIEFSNKRVIVAGAARGIGRAIVNAFAERGATVWAGDLLTEEIAPLAGRSGSGVVHTAHLDVTDPVSIDRFVAMAADKGVVDILVYVAGGVRGQTAQPVESVAPEDFHAIVDANLIGAFLCTRAVAPGMKHAGRGRIVTISSRAGLVTSLTGIASYAAAKHGQVGLVKQLAQELGPFGINVNSVAPGFMATSPDYERQWARYSPERRAALEQGIAMRRMGTPEDIAYAVMFLASDYASWITGQVLPVTGSPLV